MTMDLLQIVVPIVTTIIVIVVFLWKCGTKEDIKTLREEIRAHKADTDKKFEQLQADMNRQFEEVREDIKELRGELKELRGELRSEIQEVRSEIRELRVEMDKKFSEVWREIRALNQNHIDHLAHHNRLDEDDSQ